MMHAKVHVFYRVGTVVKQINNVDLPELKKGLRNLSDDAKNVQTINDVLLGTPSDSGANIDKWVEAMSVEPKTGSDAKLVVDQDTTCMSDASSSFFDRFWASKTEAGRVLCLLRSILAGAQKKRQDAVDEAIRNAFKRVAPKTVDAALPEVKPDAVQQWNMDWERRNLPGARSWLTTSST